MPNEQGRDNNGSGSRRLLAKDIGCSWREVCRLMHVNANAHEEQPTERDRGDE